MNAPTPTRTLADIAGRVVTDDGRRVLVFDRCTGALTVLAFVLGLLTLVTGGYGAVALVTGAPSGPLGAALLAVGLVIAAATDAVVRKIRRRRGQPLHECRPVAVIDRKLGLFSYGGGAVVPRGTHVLKRGSPFDGGIGNVDGFLSAVVRSG
jgi:hypothetical protein